MEMPSKKTERLLELMELSDEKPLVFLQFTTTARVLVEQLGGLKKCAYLHGALTQAERQREIERFHTDPNLQAFVY